MHRKQTNDKRFYDLTGRAQENRIQMLEADVSKMWVMVQDMQAKVEAMAKVGGWDDPKTNNQV